MKKILLYVGVYLFLMSCAFKFSVQNNTSELEWLWKDKVQVAVILWVSAIICLISALFNRRTSKIINR